MATASRPLKTGLSPWTSDTSIVTSSAYHDIHISSHSNGGGETFFIPRMAVDEVWAVALYISDLFMRAALFLSIHPSRLEKLEGFAKQSSDWCGPTQQKTEQD